MKLSTLFTLAIVGTLTIVSQANADVLLSDTFTQSDGTSLTGTIPSPGPGGVWTNHSGTAGDLLIQAGQAVVQHGTPSEDTHSQFTDITSGILSANFDITVNASGPITSGDEEYFAHFMVDGSNANFTSRLYVTAGGAGGDYSFGLSEGSGGFTDMFPTDFTFGNVINGTLEYNFLNGLSSFTVGGTTIFSSPGGGFETLLNSFGLRQSDSNENESIFIDNLVVQGAPAVPEPGSFVVLSFIGLAGLAKRRRK